MSAEDAGPPTETERPTLRRDLTIADYQALGAFRHALRKFLAFSAAGAEAQGLTIQQHQALLAIKAHPGPDAMSVGELAQSLLIKNHSAGELVGRLAERGLAERRPSPEDRRRVLLAITPQGEVVLEVISRSNLGKLKRSVPAFADLLRALDELELPPPVSDDSI